MARFGGLAGLVGAFAVAGAVNSPAHALTYAQSAKLSPKVEKLASEVRGLGGVCFIDDYYIKVKPGLRGREILYIWDGDGYDFEDTLDNEYNYLALSKFLINKHGLVPRGYAFNSPDELESIYGTILDQLLPAIDRIDVPKFIPPIEGVDQRLDRKLSDLSSMVIQNGHIMDSDKPFTYALPAGNFLIDCTKKISHGCMPSHMNVTIKDGCHVLLNLHDSGLKGSFHGFWEIQSQSKVKQYYEIIVDAALKSMQADSTIPSSH